jgi:hypothetical protein
MITLGTGWPPAVTTPSTGIKSVGGVTGAFFLEHPPIHIRNNKKFKAANRRKVTELKENISGHARPIHDRDNTQVTDASHKTLEDSRGPARPARRKIA